MDYDHAAEMELAEMALDVLRDEVNLWSQLAEGCKKHRSYRAIRSPRVDCAKCYALYEIRKELL